MHMHTCRKDDRTCECRGRGARGHAAAAAAPDFTGPLRPLSRQEINDIRLCLFTKKKSDGTSHLILQGYDVFHKYGRRVRDGDVPAICSYVKRSPKRIVRLDLRCNELTDAGFVRLVARCLAKQASGIKHLNVDHNRLTDASVAGLAYFAPFVSLECLKINGNEIGAKGGEQMARFLAHNASVQRAEVAQTSLTVPGLAHLCSALRSDADVSPRPLNSSLTVVDLSRVVAPSNRYPCESDWLAYHIELLLTNNCIIRELHVQKNELSGVDFESVARGLRVNQSLRHLDLGYNRIGARGAELLAPHLHCIDTLNVAGNGIGDDGAWALSAELPASHVRALDVSHNRLTECGVLHLLHTLKKWRFMLRLRVWGNTLGHAACEILERMAGSGVVASETGAAGEGAETDVRVYEVDGVLYAARLDTTPF